MQISRDPDAVVLVLCQSKHLLIPKGFLYLRFLEGTQWLQMVNNLLYLYNENKSQHKLPRKTDVCFHLEMSGIMLFNKFCWLLLLFCCQNIQHIPISIALRCICKIKKSPPEARPISKYKLCELTGCFLALSLVSFVPELRSFFESYSERQGVDPKLICNASEITCVLKSMSYFLGSDHLPHPWAHLFMEKGAA